MSRLKQRQNIDRIIQCINSILESRCSLSDREHSSLNEAIVQLQVLKKKKGKTNKEIVSTTIKIVELLSEYFKK